MLTVNNLYCERDERVLFQNLDFSVAEGEAWQIQGSNGSGKTTLLRILCGLNDEFTGEILWRGIEQRKARQDFNREVFYLGHAPAINKALTAKENLSWYCASRGLTNTDQIKTVLNSFNLYGYEDMPCYLMSAGQQRRVSLARMLLSQAMLWMLDEPFTALDKQGVLELEVLLSEHAKTGGSIILTTHHNLQMDYPLQSIDLDALAGLVAA
ncbi:MAG: heme ABC transporter ATP-binding protein CcmA [SAR86 cluster bacterium]|uniref:Heme ABC transporter ATP-binding protein CcmA n=1 Tax=SAR86 cluster bacterium TaxID=2030880 RepID=A0A2A5CCD5_9GAMM|nr:cytochrome c biogenesis heme-transporting ATPase CcmA [Gammaproteobacteria bacterium AH-315-E17]PCJ41452.1 MAG: heme ABC transporter ATP-binding protein CcmA [SAR86 cluster bacterium]